MAKFVNNKKIAVTLSTIFLVLIVFSLFNAVFAGTPTFNFSADEKSYSVSDDSMTFGTITVRNTDPARWIVLRLYGKIRGKEGWFYFEEDYVGLNPMETSEIDYILFVPSGVCDDTYQGGLMAKLVFSGDYPSSDAPIAFSTAIRSPMEVEVNSGISCSGDPIPGLDTPISEGNKNTIYSLLGKDPNEPVPDMIPFSLLIDVLSLGRSVFHDVDGEGVFIPSEGDSELPYGTARIYDFSDTLLSETDLSTTTGRYNIPSGTFTGPQDFYITVDTIKFDPLNPGELDKTWKGNLYVNRMGDSSDIGSAFVVTNKNTYNEIIENVDLRSRNTDQSGSWDAGTLSIGPDDKDQIISPTRWDYEVATENFKYADLDYDGRIDPDDKDHVISPLYWDFPN